LCGGGYFLGIYSSGKLTWGKNCVDEIQSNTALQVGRWYHIAGTRSKGEDSIYINGVLDNSAARADFDAITTPLTIGGRADVQGWSLDGLIDDVAIFNAVLTEADIKSIMNQGLDRALGITAVSPSGKLATTWAAIKAH
jgi:hypothetical protein